jgi:hypothetical protein
MMEEERLQEHTTGETDEPEAERKPPQSETLAKQMAEAKKQILLQRQGLSEDNRKAVEEKLTEANKALSNFSHGKLIKSIEEQHKTLKDELISLANITQNNNEEKANKAAFDNAVQTYLNKRLELARVRLQEIAAQDKQSIKAQREICKQFYTPEGKTESEDVINNLGNEFSYIERQEGTVFKSQVTVKCINGVYTSNSPPDLALTIKAKGHNSFKFTGAHASHTGAEHLIESIEEMLKVGIKNITIDDKLWEKMFSSPQQRYGHSSGDYAAQLVQYMKGVKQHQKDRLKQLRRICAASTSATSSPCHPASDTVCSST